MTNTHELPAGTTLRLMFQSCQCHPDYLIKPDRVLPTIGEAIRQSDLTEIKQTSHAFEDGGYTAAIILAESHVAIHTWPEFDNMVLVDVSVCDFYRSNRQRTINLGNYLKDIFEPQHVVRELLSMIPRVSEESVPGAGSYVELKSLLDSRKSLYQEIVVADTESYGRSLFLDGYFQTSEYDHMYYHEPLVHVPMLAHPNPEIILICGGGDGGAAHAVLQHPSVKRCVLVDIDEEVINVSRQFLSGIHQGALDDPRVEIHTQDAKDFIQHCSDEFDVIIMDTTDPGSCADSLFTQDFFQLLHEHSTEDARLSMHVSCPMTMGDISTQVFDRVNNTFENVFPYMHFVPGYGTLMAFTLAQRDHSELPTIEDIYDRMMERELTDLQLIAPDTYHALFAIAPKFRKYFPGVEWGTGVLSSVVR